MDHVREDLTDEALVARAKASSRCYTARWGVISMLLFEDWAELCGVRRAPQTAFFAYAHARAPAFFADVGRLPAALDNRPRVQGDEGSQGSRVGRRQRRWLA